MGRKRKRAGGSSLEEVNRKYNDSSRDTLKLCHIFPEEIWLLIFEILSNVKGSLQNLSNASPYFRNILLEKRVHFLFPNAWEILAIQYESKHRTDNSFNEDANNDSNRRPRKLKRQTCPICGVRQTKKWFSGILNLRLVCKSWSRAFDNFLPELPFHRKWGKLDLEKVGTQDFRQQAIVLVDMFLKHFGKIDTKLMTGRSPFLGSSIYLQFGQPRRENEDEEQFLLGIQRILTKYGKYFLNCEFSTDCLYELSADFYIKMKRILELMPNLKRLTIKHYYDISYLDSDMQNILDETISREPIAALNQIEYLQVRNLHFPIFNELIRLSRNVSKLDGPIHEAYDIYNAPLPKLEDLYIRYESRSGFEKLSGSHWPLEKLMVDFETEFFMDWSEVFTVIQEKWKNSLSDLTLKLPKAKTMKDKNKIAAESIYYRLKLCSLKRLNLTIFNFTSLDFILPLKSTLEYLNVNLQWRGEHDCRPALATTLIMNQKIQFLNYFERPLESNIWTIFPKLKTIEFNCSFGLRRNAKKINWSHRRWEWNQYNLEKLSK